MVNKWMLIYLVKIITDARGDSCLTAIPLRDVEVRGTGCSVKTLNNVLCDRQLTEGWYKAELGGEMLQMTTVCPSLFSCGTFGSIWLNGSHPDVVNTSRTVSACRRGTAVDLNQCCSETIPVTIKNCGNFYAYHLKYTSACHQAYCFGDHGCLNTHATSSSEITPKTSTQRTAVSVAKQNPCLIARPLGDTEVRGTNCNGPNLDKLLCDRQITEGWYKAEFDDQMLQMPTTCPELFACGTIGGIWLNGDHPSTVNTTLTIHVCRRGTAADENGCCVDSFPIDVKHCGDFYAYRLTHTPTCYQAYCFGTNVCQIRLNTAQTAPSTRWSTISSSTIGVQVTDNVNGFILLKVSVALLTIIGVIGFIWFVFRYRMTVSDQTQKTDVYLNDSLSVFPYQKSGSKDLNVIFTMDQLNTTKA